MKLCYYINMKCIMNRSLIILASITKWVHELRNASGMVTLSVYGLQQVSKGIKLLLCASRNAMSVMTQSTACTYTHKKTFCYWLHPGCVHRWGSQGKAWQLLHSLIDGEDHEHCGFVSSIRLLKGASKNVFSVLEYTFSLFAFWNTNTHLNIRKITKDICN